MSRRSMKVVNVDVVKEQLDYDLSTGVFTWRNRMSRAVKAGTVAGTINKRGYRTIKVDGKLIREARLAWVYVYGEFPTNELDHINGIRHDNRISNLREVTHLENMQNQGVCARNKSGYCGVSVERGKFRARVAAHGKEVHLGFFDDAYSAHVVVEAEAKRLRGNLHRGVL